jgi:hypothetical protein
MRLAFTVKYSFDIFKKMRILLKIQVNVVLPESNKSTRSAKMKDFNP